MVGLTRYKNKAQKYFGRVLFLVYDVVTIFLSYFLSLWLRYDCRISMIPGKYSYAFLNFSYIIIPITIYVYAIFHLYKSVWKYITHSDFFTILQAVALSFLIHCAGITVMFRRMPLTYYFLGAAFQFIFVFGSRSFVRGVFLVQKYLMKGKLTQKAMLIGIGEVGRNIIKDSNRFMKEHESIVCIIDDDKSIWGDFVAGIEVVGGRESIISTAKKNNIEKIYIAIPSDTIRNRKELLELCELTGAKVKIMPEVEELLNGDIKYDSFREVSILDLLEREEIQVDLDEIEDYLSGKTVLVTGGGGSIGSELCREIAANMPKKLIIFDIYENNAYAIQQELREKYGEELNLEVIIGSVRDRRKVFELFDEYRPDIVYHAAAHKHVPLMEDSPCESIKNNVAGTYICGFASMLYGAEKFVLISTDKAVNPTNIMGASKRMCEMVVQTFAHKLADGSAVNIPYPVSDIGNRRDLSESDKEKIRNCNTGFVAVRFGNVLGSNGSVVPLFKNQIANGGPVTVTHPDIIRYFMTIPEAVSLVLQAGYYAKGGEIFVLDMGKPVKIDKLARNLIRLSGYVPDQDIKIVYTGLRKGEKLYEELLMGEEGLKQTPNNLIFIGKPIKVDETIFFNKVTEIIAAAYTNDLDIRAKVNELVKTYKRENS